VPYTAPLVPVCLISTGTKEAGHSTCTKHSRGPLRTRQAAGGKGLQLLLYVVLDPSDRWGLPIKNQIGCAGITVVRKTDASGVDQESWVCGNAANERAMCMPKGNDGLAK
jgi:hypothetical protein